MDYSESLEGMPGDPNGPAYRKTETRTGPPLDYVAEKLKLSLEALHSTIRAIQETVPENLPQPQAAIGSTYSVKQDALFSPAWDAFRCGLTAFLALQNFLVLANDQGIFDRLLGYSREEFRNWLGNIEREGLVSG
ncbi:MAG: hypothetical protein ABIJ00_05565 [Candidatus Eisenbacteria bacterium]